MRKPLLVSGTLLMILGFFQGFTLDLIPNRELALAAHVSAIQNGLIIVVIGIAWQYVSLNKLEKPTAWLVIFGLYALWLGLFVAAALGLTSPMDSVTTSLFQFSGSLVLLVSFFSLLFGFIKHDDG